MLVQKDSHLGVTYKTLRLVESEGFCSFLHLITDSYDCCVTSKADSSKKRNPILHGCCTRRAA